VEIAVAEMAEDDLAALRCNALQRRLEPGEITRRLCDRQADAMRDDPADAAIGAEGEREGEPVFLRSPATVTPASTIAALLATSSARITVIRSSGSTICEPSTAAIWPPRKPVPHHEARR
jgi:hypothetical protein